MHRMNSQFIVLISSILALVQIRYQLPCPPHLWYTGLLSLTTFGTNYIDPDLFPVGFQQYWQDWYHNFLPGINIHLKTHAL